MDAASAAMIMVRGVRMNKSDATLDDIDYPLCADDEDPDSIAFGGAVHAWEPSGSSRCRECYDIHLYGVAASALP